MQNDMTYPHKFFMDVALKEAEAALSEREVPIGAVVVQGESIIGRGHNQVEQTKDPTAHAEILAIRQAGLTLANWRLSECRIYITVEPCVMCLGAILLTRMREIIYALREPKTGAIRSRIGTSEIWADKNLLITEGVRRSEALLLLQTFFVHARDKNIRRGTEVWP